MRLKKQLQYERNKVLNDLPNEFPVIDAVLYRDFVNRNVQTGMFENYRRGWYRKNKNVFPLPTQLIEEVLHTKKTGIKW